MSDPLPFWALLLRWLGWEVVQSFIVVEMDRQFCPRVWTDGFPSYRDAEIEAARCNSDHELMSTFWVQRVIEVTRDDR